MGDAVAYDDELQLQGRETRFMNESPGHNQRKFQSRLSGADLFVAESP